VIVPVMNKGHQPVTLGVEKALVALEEAQYASNPIATQEDVSEDDGETKAKRNRESYLSTC
jgi:hypothetical protein